MHEGPLYVEIQEKEGVKFYIDSSEFSIYGKEKNLQHSHENLDLNEERNEIDIDDKYFK